MDTQLLISGFIFGLSIGSIFFLLAIGLSLCFGLMRIISLDQLFYYAIGALGSIKGTLVSAFIVGQVISLGSIFYAPLAQMAPFAIMLLILLIKPTGLYGSKLLKR